MHTRQKGHIGENVACTFLESKGFTVLERNYQKKWGELDIIASKEGRVHFFEVKSVTYGSAAQDGGHRPEENVHGLKRRSIRRMVETYLAERNISPEVEFQFHVLCVYMNEEKRTARVKWLNNIVL